jgi:hypothetical protein
MGCRFSDEVARNAAGYSSYRGANGAADECAGNGSPHNAYTAPSYFSNHLRAHSSRAYGLRKRDRIYASGLGLLHVKLVRRNMEKSWLRLSEQFPANDKWRSAGFRSFDGAGCWV